MKGYGERLGFTDAALPVAASVVNEKNTVSMRSSKVISMATHPSSSLG